ncbi:unnamed protein product [marine sediment metagenome]|uniref:FAD dependent oxidoreductase n=1 Tax=marine sediment metagenome TaxID=412755 RepID=X1GQV5_9ZZZZ
MQMATDLGIRISRGIYGEATLLSEHTSSGKAVYFDDTIGCTPASADFEKTGEFFHAHTFDIPYSIMVPKKIDNVLVGSGKSVSCEHQGIIRGMSTCMMLGQAAGAAAGIAAQNGASPRELDIRKVQRELINQGVNLGSEDRLKALGLE